VGLCLVSTGEPSLTVCTEFVEGCSASVIQSEANAYSDESLVQEGTAVTSALKRVEQREFRGTGRGMHVREEVPRTDHFSTEKSRDNQ